MLVENKLNELSEKAKLLSAKDCSFFLGRIYFSSNDGSQNMFVYQQTFSVLELKKEKGTEYFIGWKSKGVYFKYKIGIQLDNTPLVIEQKHYVSKM